MQITKEQLKKWSACRDGYGWFLDKFPAGAAPYADVMAALNADGRRADAGWLVGNAYAEWADNPEFIRAETAATDAMVAELTALQVDENAEGVENSSGNYAQIGSSGYDARIGSSGDGAQIGSSGYDARIGSSGNGARIGSSGDYARIGSSGYDARIGSSGDGAQIGSSGDGARIGSSGDGARIGSSGYGARIGSSGDGAQIGSSGDGARIGSSGDGARIGSSGYGAQIDATGKNPVVACAGTGAMFSLGTGGCAAVPYEDSDGRIRFAIAYEGENVEAGKRYCVNGGGSFELAETDDEDQDEPAA